MPLYALIPSVFMLFVLQSLVIAAGAPAVWLIARDEGLPAVAGLAAVALYFAHPTVQYTNLDAFRERSFGALLLPLGDVGVPARSLANLPRLPGAADHLPARSGALRELLRHLCAAERASRAAT